jgi:two-component system cell cycle response regulator
VLSSMALIDGLTGIANRRSFDSFLTIEWRRASRNRMPLSLILCDVDFFKAYNDTYGHQAGDECLQKVASTISTTANRPTDFVARYGGEEFGMILPDTNASGAVVVAETVRRRVQGQKIPHCASKNNGYITISLGVATIIPTQHTNVPRLLEAADRALYEAKSAGRNQVRTSRG